MGVKLTFDYRNTILTCQQRIVIAEDKLKTKRDWFEISGEYLATGGEEYLTIGTFLEDFTEKEYQRIRKRNKLNHYNRDNSIEKCYYYLDDVSVVKAEGNNTRGTDGYR